ncbi:MAG: hypothetical protein RIS64_968 [Bacteroidota bacterium]|jgi:hypothetical protein
MKKLILALAIAAFGASSTFAQAPAAPAAAVKAAPAAAAAATQAPATAATEVKKVAKKAKKAAAKPAAAVAAAGAKMTHQCPKGCSVVDAPGKCPKCSTELVAIGGGAAKKAEKAVKAAVAPAEVKK